MTTKERLRKKIAAIQDDLPSSHVAKQSRAIVRHLGLWALYRKARSVLFYAPLKKEAQIKRLIVRALGQRKKVVLPVCDKKSGTMKPYALRSMEELARGSYGILQPPRISKRLVKPRTLDLLLVPGLAFDARGNRLGRGKGHYDQFLKRYAGKAVKVGVTLAEQIVPKVPVNGRDVPMDYLAHAGGIIRCHRADQ